MNDSGLEPPLLKAPPLLEPLYSEPPGSDPTLGQRLKKLLAPIGVALVLVFKFGAKLKFLVIPLVKFLPIFLKTGGTMILSMWAYALAWGWMFAVGFVLLIFVHECGHLPRRTVLRSEGGRAGIHSFHVLLSLPRLWSLFRKKSEEERRYFEVTPGRRLAMAGMYFGLIVFLLLGMALTHIVPASKL